MYKRRLFFLYCEFKTALKLLPRLLLCSAIMLGFVGFLALFGYRYLDSKNSAAPAVKVAAVFPGEDPAINQGFELINQMETVSSVCRLIRMEESDALVALSNHEVSAIVVIPDNFVNDLMYGVNTPARVILPDDASLETMLFRSLIDAGALSLAHSEAGMYAVLELYTDNGHTAAADHASEKLYEQYIKYTLNRGCFFDIKSITSTGNVSTSVYYTSSGIMLALLLALISSVEFFFSFNSETLDVLRSARISSAYVKLCEYLCISLIFAVPTCIGLFASGFATLTIYNVLAVIVVVASIVSLVMFLATALHNTIAAILSIFSIAIGMFYLCGRFMPSAFLPEKLIVLGKFLPATYWCSVLEEVHYDRLSVSSIVYPLCFAIIFCILSIGVVLIRQRRRTNG